MAGNRSELRRVKKGIGVDYYYRGKYRFTSSIDSMFYEIYYEGGEENILERFFEPDHGGYKYKVVKRERKPVDVELTWD